MGYKPYTAEKLISISKQFDITGTISGASAHGSGHINDTFRLSNASSASPDYLLQRINHHVFRNVPALMANIHRVTSHLKDKLSLVAGSHPDKEALTLVQAINGNNFYKDASGNYWRMYLFLEDTKSYDLVESAQQALEGGRAFGHFQALLADMDASQLSETIVDFHNLEKRLNDLDKAVSEDQVKRLNNVAPELDFIKQRTTQLLQIHQWGKAGILPVRITHNDTKFNNILFNNQDRAQCIIDLDTVMAGHAAYDFGDAVRTLINTRPEDEPEPDKIILNLPLFQAFTDGYLKEAGSFLCDKELESLPLGVLLLPYMQGVRFLTDHLHGDTYFKISFEGHNLQRARAQFGLLQKLEEAYHYLTDTIMQTGLQNKKQLIN